MINSIIYSRIIPADKDRGYVMLYSWEKPVVQRTAAQVSSLSVITPESIAANRATATKRFNATMVDVTDPSILKKLEKLFATEKPPAAV